MKKNIFLVLMLCICLTTGCVKNYKTVDEYSAAMQEVRNKLGDYTIEVAILNGNKEGQYKSFIKGDLWKTEELKNDGKTNVNGILYDGTDVLAYSPQQPYAMTIPFKQILAKQGVKDNQTTDMIMKVINPAGILLNWDIGKEDGDIDQTWKLGKTAKKNGFDCRMLYNDKTDEICVSDKYGIAVYVNMKNAETGGKMEFNVTSINNTPLTTEDVSLPEGIKKVSISDMFRNMADMLQGDEEE